MPCRSEKSLAVGHISSFQVDPGKNREVIAMKEEKKKIIIVPYPMNISGSVIGDPSGSYTGIPIFPFEDPVQDADDL